MEEFSYSIFKIRIGNDWITSETNVKWSALLDAMKLDYPCREKLGF